MEELIEEGAIEHIDELAQQYAGVEKYYGGAAPTDSEGTETRVIYKIKPTHVNTVSIG